MIPSSKNTTSLAKVSLVVAGVGGESHVTADRAEYDNTTKNVLLSGDVHGTTSKGADFRTKSLRYLAATSLLVTGNQVRFQDGGLTVEGVGMKFETRTRKVQLMRAVSAEYMPGRTR